MSFVERYKDQKIFRFLRNNPPELLSLDKALRDKAAREGKPFDLPILGSTQPLEGDLKSNLIKAVFNEETLALTKPNLSLNNKDLEAFCSSFGQVFFYWMYHSLNLELVAEMIPQVNQVKEIFTKTLGDPVARANGFRDKLIASGTSVLFTQESDALVPEVLTKDGLFHPVDRQNLQDGTLVFLRSDIWEPDYEIVDIEGYSGFQSGRLNVILATEKESGRRFVLASGHGSSTKPEDGRLQIQLIMEKFHQLSDGNLQLFIGIDANTKTEEDVHDFRNHLDILGLKATQAGPTTIKKRMVTAQHAKSGRFAVDEEDYLITLKADHGGQFQFTHVTVGFVEEKADIDQPLPNIHNPSDHYPVGAVMAPL